MPASKQDSQRAILASAAKVLETEIVALQSLRDSLGVPFCAAVSLLGQVRGRVVTTGMGKSGHIASKIAATFSSTGTPALFVHPAEAGHGDLGMITQGDAVLALSNSGETAELRAVLEYTHRIGTPLIAITSSAESTLAKQAQVALLLPKFQEACPLGLAPHDLHDPAARPRRCFSRRPVRVARF